MLCGAVSGFFTVSLMNSSLIQLPLRVCVFEMRADRIITSSAQPPPSTVGLCWFECNLAVLVLHSLQQASYQKTVRKKPDHNFFTSRYAPCNVTVPPYPPRLGGVGLLCFDLNHLELMRCLKASCCHRDAQTVRSSLDICDLTALNTQVTRIEQSWSAQLCWSLWLSKR